MASFVCLMSIQQPELSQNVAFKSLVDLSFHFKQIFWSQETATFSVTDMDTSTLRANGWCQMTTKWPCFVKMARTASGTYHQTCKCV